MKYILSLCALLCALAIPALAQSTPPIIVTEVDGSPRVTGVTKVVVSNGSLTVSGKTATITTGGTTINSTNGVIPYRSSATAFADSPFSVASGVVTLTESGIGATSTDGLILLNSTAAAAGAQQYSPRLRLTGQGWKTAATAASQTVDWIIENQPVQGSSAPTSNLVLSSQVAGGGYTARLTINSAGITTFNTASIGVPTGTAISVSSGVQITMSTTTGALVQPDAQTALQWTNSHVTIPSGSGLTLTASPLSIGGDIGASAWTTSGIRIKGSAATLTDQTSSGTVAAAYTNNLGGNTIAASSATTFTDYYNTFLTAETAGTNVTFTRNWALGLSGAALVNTSSANAFTVGPNGATNPTFQVVTNTASGATGLSITNAAAGSGVTIAALSSGSNENITLTPKGTGQVIVPDGAAATPSIGFSSTPGTGLYRFDSTNIAFTVAGSLRMRVDSNALIITNGNSSALRLNNDTVLVRAAQQVFRVSDSGSGAGSLIIGTSAGAIGTSGAGVLAFTLSTAPTSSPTDTAQVYSNDAAAGAHELYTRNEAGEIERQTGLVARNSSSFSKTSDTTLANITGITRNVEASRVYAFEGEFSTTSANTGGVKFAVSGTATATSIDYEGILYDGTAISAKTRATALDTAVCAVTAVTAATCRIRGVIVVNAAGTLTVQMAQNASDGTASVVLVNQYFQLKPIG